MTEPEGKIGRVPYALFIAVLIFAPLAFGTVELWSKTVVGLTVCVVALMLFVLHLKKQWDFISVPGLLPLLCLLLWMALQLVPLPQSLLGVISPGTLDVYRPVIEAGDFSTWLPLTVNSKATFYELLRIGVCVLFYVVTVQLLSEGRRVQKTVRIICILAVVIAFFAIVQKYTSAGAIYWFRQVPESAANNFMGPWVYKNQYAGYMAMLLPLLLGLFFYYRARVDEDLSLRVRIASALSAPGSHIRLYIAFGMVLVFLSIMVGLSRSGVVYSLIALVLYYLFLTPKSSRRAWPVLLLILVLALVYLTFFDVSDIATKFNSTLTDEGELSFNRFQTWTDTLALIKAFWLTGAGFGTFVDLFPLVKSGADAMIYDHAHNDYLEIFTDGGVIAFLLIVWFLVALLRTGWKMWRRRRDRYSVLMGGATLAGIFSMLLFSITDFNMKNGADALYFFFLCGLFISCAHTRFRFASSSTLLPEMSCRLQRGVFVGVFLLLLLLLIFPVRAFLGREVYRQVEQVYITRNLAPAKLEEVRSKLKRASRLDPLEGAYLAALGDVEKIFGEKEVALDLYLLAGLKNPLRGLFLQKIAIALPEEKAMLADELMEKSYQRSFQKDELTLVFVEWLLWKDEKQRAVEILHEGLERNPRLIAEVLSMFGGRLSPEEMADAFPEYADVWGNYGRYLEQKGEIEACELFYKKAVDLAESSGEKKSHWFNRLYTFYMQQKREDDAAFVLLRGVEVVPEYARFHIWLGDYYRRQGLTYKARDQYKEALLFDPNNDGVKKRLEELGL